MGQTTTKRQIRISDGNEIVGYGLVADGGEIECPAELGDNVYSAIEQAIADGKDRVEVGGTMYRWWMD
jgi:3-oxoacyl-(acyl-carrier-protein) synthase